MGYTVATTANTQVANSAATVTGMINQPAITFAKAAIGGVNYETYPITVPTRIAVNSSETVNLNAFYKGSSLITKLLIVKASRPVLVTVSGTYTNLPFVYTLPPQTYVHHVFDSREVTYAFKPMSIIITNPDSSSTQPSPLPEAYPAAEVEVFVAVQESI